MGCPSTQVYHQHGAYIREVWAWFAIGTAIIILRMFVRLRTVGWRKLMGDDYVAPLVWIFFLCDSVTVTIVYFYGSNLDYTEAQLQHLKPCQIDKIRTGSQMQLLAWYTYVSLLWGLKTMVLFFLTRLSFGLFHRRLIRLFATLICLSYLAVFITISTGCFPIQRNWQVLPLPPHKCTMKPQNFYVVTAFNISTDLMIMSIPIPLLWTLKVSLGKRVVLTFMLCSGIFMIAAAILRICFSLSGQNAVNINKWGTRETICGILAVNAPILRPAFRRGFWLGERDGERSAVVSPNDETPEGNRTTGSDGRRRARFRNEDLFSDLKSIEDDEQTKSRDVLSLREGCIEIGTCSRQDTLNNSTGSDGTSVGDLESGIKVESTSDMSSNTLMPTFPPPVAASQPKIDRQSRRFRDRAWLNVLAHRADNHTDSERHERLMK